MKWLALALLVAGCTDSTDLLPADGSAPACMPPGPLVQLGGAACASALAAGLMRHAICACGSMVLDRGLYTEGGAMQMPNPGQPPSADVGTDGNLQVAGSVQLDGSLTVAGAAGASFARTSAVLGDVRSGGPLGSDELLSIGGDAYANGDVFGRIEVQGAIHLPNSANLSPDVTAATIIHEPVTVAEPCCPGPPPLDVGKLVAAHAQTNDDATVPLGPDTFTGATTPPASIDLPCGQFYLSSLTLTGNLDVNVHGRAALYVGGDVTLGDGLRVILDPPAELDLLVAGDLSVSSGTLGATPAASMRVWLASQKVHLGAGASLSAIVYAPEAVIDSDGDVNVTGAILAQSYSPAGDLYARFDRNVLAGGKECEQP